jgi:hypothetical protein
MSKLVLLAGGSIVAVLMTAASALAQPMAPGAYAGGGPVGYGPGTSTTEDYPPNAQPGQCFAKVLVPEVTETYTEQVLVSPEKTITRVVPGDCGFEDKTVVVREPSTELITIPATFKTVTETVVTKPGGAHTQTVPPVYDTVTEQVKVREGYTVWRPGSTVAGYNPGGYGAPPPSAYAGTGAAPNPAYGGLPTRVLATGEVLCLVQVPPEYKTITKQVLRTPGSTVDVPYPPETTVVSRQVVDIPAHVEKREIPGETKIIKVKVCRPDQTTSATIPPEFKTVTKVRTITPSKFEWKTVDCKTEVTHAYAPPPPPPMIRSYGEAPPPPLVHHYHPPVVHHDAAPKKAYIPPPPPPMHHGKVCHQTCDDASTSLAPESVSPPMAPPPVRAYSTASIAPSNGDHAVATLQGALAAKGYYNGPQNGLFTQSTMTAMVKYQHDNHLAEGRYTGETANSLGITR